MKYACKQFMYILMIVYFNKNNKFHYHIFSSHAKSIYILSSLSIPFLYNNMLICIMSIHCVIYDIYFWSDALFTKN